MVNVADGAAAGPRAHDVDLSHLVLSSQRRLDSGNRCVKAGDERLNPLLKYWRADEMEVVGLSLETLPQHAHLRAAGAQLERALLGLEVVTENDDAAKGPSDARGHLFAPLVEVP